MNFPDYPLNCSRNFSQIVSGALPSVSVKRKAEESKIENQEEKTSCLAVQRFNSSGEECKMVADLWQESLSSDALSDVSKEKEIATTKQLWQFLNQCLPKMMPESYFYFEGIPVHKDIIKELLKNPPNDSLDRLCARQIILCKDNQQIIITGFEKILLEQRSPVLKLLFEDHRFQEANGQNLISWAIDQKIFEIFLRSLYQPNILLDEQKELNEEEKEKTFIDLLDQANLWEIKELKRDLISWFQKKLALLDKRKDKDLAKIVEWHTFAHSRELTSLQKSCEDFLINSFLAAEDNQEKQRLIETLKMIQMTQLDVSAYDNDERIVVYLKKVADLIKELSLTELNLGSCPWLADNGLALLKDLPLKKLTIADGRTTDHGLMHLKNMPLEELSLPRSDLTDESFSYLQGFKNLRVLDLTESSGRITGKELIHLKDLPLQTLILSVTGNLEHECLTHLKHFTNLQMLDLYIHNMDIGAVGKNFLAPLADLPYLRILHLDIPGNVDCLTHLKKLSLEEFRFTSDVIRSHDLENLEGLPLRKLSLGGLRGIEDAALTHLKKLHLEELFIFGGFCPNSLTTNAGIAHLGDLSSLKKLMFIGGRDLTGACLIHLQNLSRLEELECDVQTIKGGDLGKLEGLPLRKLFLMSRQGIKDAALTDLKKLHLEKLTIMDFSYLSRLTNAGIAYLGDLSSLKKLKLKGENLTGDCLIHLQNLPCLNELNCDLQTIKGGDLGNLEGLPLRKLSLTSCWEENDPLAHLKAWHLEELEIGERYSSNNNLTNADVAHLGDLPSLKKLTLKGKNLTGDCLIYLQNLSHLENFSYCFPIKYEDLSYLKNLKKKLPLLKINKLLS